MCYLFPADLNVSLFLWACTDHCQCPFNTVQVKIREVSPEGIRVTMEERICERDEF